MSSRIATTSAELGAVSVPRVYRVVARRPQLLDVMTLLLSSIDGSRLEFRTGQFNMLSVVGVGEVAISISDAPRPDGMLHHTIRDVGLVSHALCDLDVGDVLGVRGPFGSDWRYSCAEVDGVTRDVVIVAGGVGLAPLRGVANQLVEDLREGEGRVCILVGARDPSQVIFGDDLAEWSRRGAQVQVTVDRATPRWSGRVGLVTTLLGVANFEPRSARALICGPEIMMRSTARSLQDLGVDPRRILISLERNMQCGIGWCGHCQYGPFLLCRDGPILPYAGTVPELLMEREV